MRAINRLLLGSFGVLLLSHASASAQDADPRIAQARAVFEEGEAHHADGRFLLAAESFERAYALMREAGHPNAGMVLYNLGASYDELPGRERQAIDAYERFLREAPASEPTVQELTPNVQARIRELERRAGAGGGGLSPVGPIVMAVGGAAVIAGVIMGGIALTQDGDQVERCPSRTDCPESLRDEVEQTRTLAAVGDGFWIGGAVVAATGLVLLFVLPSEEGSTTQTTVSVTGAPGGGLVRVGARF